VVIALLGTGCASTKKTVNTSTELRATESRSTEVHDSVVVAEHDTIREVTTITVQLGADKDTVFVSQVTERDRVRDRWEAAATRERVEVRVDTVFVERRDSVEVQTNGGAGAPKGPGATLLRSLRWIFFILLMVVILVLAVKFGKGFLF